MTQPAAARNDQETGTSVTRAELPAWTSPCGAVRITGRSRANFTVFVMCRQAPLAVSMLTGVAVAVAATTAAPRAATAQPCEAMSGPERTECFIARARLAGAKANTAVAASRQLGDAAILARKTGTSTIPKTRRVKSGSR